MVSIGEIWGVNILSKFQGILYGPTALPFLSWDMISISDESVGERKNDESIFSQDIQGEFFCSGDFWINFTSNVNKVVIKYFANFFSILNNFPIVDYLRNNVEFFTFNVDDRSNFRP